MLVKWLLGEVGWARRSSSALRSSLSPLGAGGRAPIPALLEENSSPPPRGWGGKEYGSLIEGKLEKVSFLFTVWKALELASTCLSNWCFEWRIWKVWTESTAENLCLPNTSAVFLSIMSIWSCLMGISCSILNLGEVCGDRAECWAEWTSRLCWNPVGTSPLDSDSRFYSGILNEYLSLGEYGGTWISMCLDLVASSSNFTPLVPNQPSEPVPDLRL